VNKNEATRKLLALKAECHDACDEATTAVAELDPDARKKAVVAHHVQQHGADSLSVALAAGPFKFLDEAHIAEVGRVAAAGGDPVVAAGAEPEHVALLEAARVAHAEHGDELAQAYADFAAAD
jgi:hypothetical protein